MKCSNCGGENEEGVNFCQYCGAKLEQETNFYQNDFEKSQTGYDINYGNTRNYNNSGYTGNSGYSTLTEAQLPEEYRPLTMWGYFGYQLLFSIPCVGFIFLVIIAFGGTRNINLRNFARSYFCVMIIMIVLIVLFSLLGGGIASLFRARYY